MNAEERRDSNEQVAENKTVMRGPAPRPLSGVLETMMSAEERRERNEQVDENQIVKSGPSPSPTSGLGVDLIGLGNMTKRESSVLTTTDPQSLPLPARPLLQSSEERREWNEQVAENKIVMRGPAPPPPSGGNVMNRLMRIRLVKSGPYPPPTSGSLKGLNLDQLREMWNDMYMIENISMDQKRAHNEVISKAVLSMVLKKKPLLHDDLLLPDDLTKMILEHLPGKTLMRFLSVKKQWAAMIESESFRETYRSTSEKKPKILFSATIPEKPESKLFTCHRFLSILQEKPNSFIQEPSLLAVLKRDYTHKISQPTGGLLCCFRHTKSLVCNPSIGKLIDLPDVDDKLVFFTGINPVTREFKVLAKPESSSTACVLTFMTDNTTQTWRTIDTAGLCHSARSSGIYFGGYLYYVAHVSEETADLLISFDLVTEVFKFVKLPDDLLTDFDGQPGDRLVTFNNQLAIAQDDGDSNLLTLWLLDDKCSWFKREIIIP
ncbi:unnamed protein product [Eruca vesicaria subsp. sativa]|uniref:F-box domain-containing protein n=1 Tax=Eruca vesicaria subsp. sativa TaxID=29727 RepID=A0ABC8IY86_ERUVS|nr:unnamed protein product [Eruca vesicaria subsp. sativa]